MGKKTKNRSESVGEDGSLSAEKKRKKKKTEKLDGESCEKNSTSSSSELCLGEPVSAEKKRKKKKKKTEKLDGESCELNNISSSSELCLGEPVSAEKKRKKKKTEKLDGESCEKNNTSSNEHCLGGPTVTMAVSGSIINNAQSLELATRLASQIARAATIFRIDEVVVFDNNGSSASDSTVDNSPDSNQSGAAFLVRILQYLETPQYLRKSLFPKDNNLRYVGMLPPLDAPHHLRKHEWAAFREGITLKEKTSNVGGTMVDVGLSQNVIVNQALEPGVRVTVDMGTNRDLNLPRQVVSLSSPKEAGIYWGYRVRYASSISSVFNDCPFQGGYDHSIGTSEHGAVINSSELDLPVFRHLLIAFGGLAGLEESIKNDDYYKGKNVRDAFDQYLNTCSNQGSRTIRTEEAIFISLQYFHEPIKRAVTRVEKLKGI